MIKKYFGVILQPDNPYFFYESPVIDDGLADKTTWVIVRSMLIELFAIWKVLVSA